MGGQARAYAHAFLLDAQVSPPRTQEVLVQATELTNLPQSSTLID